MDPLDMLVLYVETLPFEEAAFVMMREGQRNPNCVLHPSVRWWADKHASTLMAWIDDGRIELIRERLKCLPKV